MNGATLSDLLWLAAYGASALVGYLGHRAGALTHSGGIAAWLVGGSILAFGGLVWALLLVLFFVSSSALSFLRADDQRKRRAAEMFEKGGRRDAAQVLANGGVAALAAIFLPVGPYGLLFAAFVGSLAAATADTWATELGVLSGSLPRSITTGKAVELGTSGGITLLGTVASVTGALILSGAAALLSTVLSPAQPTNAVYVLLAGTLGGVGGSLFDSLLGATVQATYHCPACGKPSESPIHRCGTECVLVDGIRQVNNDAVNFAATLFGGLAAAAIWTLFG